MKCYIHYIKDYNESEVLADQCLDSFKTYSGWEPILQEGFTPDTLVGHEKYRILEPSALRILQRVPNKPNFSHKLSSIMNNIRLWNRVVEENETMVFLEHDVVCVRDFEEINFQDVCHLSPFSETAERYGGLYTLRGGIYHDSKVIGGTHSYMITPSGAKKMLNACSRYGLECSDGMLNTFNVDIEYSTSNFFDWVSNTLNTSAGKHTL